jgi:hypothetical protein
MQSRVENEVAETAPVDVGRQRIGAWPATARDRLGDPKAAAQVPVGGERRHVGDDRRAWRRANRKSRGTERHTGERNR